MMIGLRGGLGITVGPQSGDQCLNMSTYQVEPCTANSTQDLCFDPNSNQHGTCAQMPGAVQVPVLTLGDILQRCNTPQCQVVSAVPPGTQACDPLIRAAGYDCQTVGGGLLDIWSKAAIVNGQLYTSDGEGVIPAPSANQYGLTPAQTSYLIANGIIAPVSSMNQTILPNANAAPPTSGPGAPNAVLSQYVQSGIPNAAALPPPVTYLPAVPMTPGYSTPDTLALGTGSTPAYSTPGGTIPGSNTATNGPSAYAPVAAASTTILPGIPNNYLYIGGAALLALLLLKK